MISKACEPCRKRKIKCDGQAVCNGCQKTPSACVYRPKTRMRARRSTPNQNRVIPPGGVNSVGPFCEAIEPLQCPALAETDIANPALCRDVTATNHSTQHTDSLQLFYGPASSFAFLQHIHRAIQGHEALDSVGGPLEEGLDKFMMRGVFFGIPSRISLQSIPAQATMDEIIPRPHAVELLDTFKAFSLHNFPLFTSTGLDGLLNRAYDHTASVPHQSQTIAVLLVILAIGSLSSAETNEAELLFQHAKRQAEASDDAVTLSMICFSLLIADYQLNMGRPNAAYLHISVACRKAYALGLHALSAHVHGSKHEIEERRVTLWVVYCYDSWIAFCIGRPNNMRKDDLTCPYPDDQPVLVDQCHVAAAMEDASALIYSKQFESVLQLYIIVEGLHNRLLQSCKRLGAEALNAAWQASQTEILMQVTLLNMYYHLVLTIYRPFLIIESTLRSAGKYDQIEMLWLRPACKQATAAAEDCLALMRQTRQIVDVKQMRRVNAAFIETSCAVLLYDSLCHPSQHPSNIEFVHLGLDLLQSMINDEPVANAARSVQRIVVAVEQSLSKVKGPGILTVPLSRETLVGSTTQLNTASLPLRQDMTSRDEGLHSSAVEEAEATGYPDLFQIPEVDLDALAADLFDFIPMDRSLFLDN